MEEAPVAGAGTHRLATGCLTGALALVLFDVGMNLVTVAPVAARPVAVLRVLACAGALFLGGAACRRPRRLAALSVALLAFGCIALHAFPAVPTAGGG